MEILKTLLWYNANVNVVDNSNYTPLHLAAMGNRKWNKEIICILLEKGAQINAEDCRGLAPIHTAFLNGQFENTIQLMNLGATLDILPPHEDSDEYGLSVLHWAVLEGDINIVEKLLKHGIDVEDYIGENCNFECHIEGEPVRSFKGITALHLATLLGHAEIVKLLLDYGAPTMYDGDLVVPLNLAMHIGEVTLKLNNDRQIKKVIDADSNTIIVSKLLPKINKEWKDIGELTPSKSRLQRSCHNCVSTYRLGR